jgi:hypothetical protein
MTDCHLRVRRKGNLTLAGVCGWRLRLLFCTREWLESLPPAWLRSPRRLLPPEKPAPARNIRSLK